MMKDPMEEIHTRLDRVQEDQQKQSDSRNEGSSKKGKSDEDDYYSHKSGSSKSSHRRPRRARETSGRFDDNLGGVKLKIPTFYGKNDHDASHIKLNWCLIANTSLKPKRQGLLPLNLQIMLLTGGIK